MKIKYLSQLESYRSVRKVAVRAGQTHKAKKGEYRRHEKHKGKGWE